MDYAQAVARVLSARIAQAKTTTARATVTAVTSDGFVTFTDALGATRKGVWLSQQPLVGDIITYLDEGSGFPLVLGTSGDRAWITPTLENSWINYSPTIGGDWEQAGYRKIGDIVYVRGLVRGGTLPSTVFTLPTGYRPPKPVLFATDADSAHARIDANPDGRVYVQAAAGNGYLSLSPMFFSTTT